MNYKAIIVANEKQFENAISRGSKVIIIDNSQGLFDIVYSKIKDLNKNNMVKKSSKGAAIFGGVTLVASIINPALAIGEMILLGATTAGMGAMSKVYSKKGIKNYSLLTLDEQKKEVVLIHKDYNKKKDTYHRFS